MKIRRPSLTLPIATDLMHLANVGKDWIREHPNADPYIRARIERAILYCERLGEWRRATGKPGGSQA